MPLIRWGGGGKEQRAKQRRQFLEEARLSELRQYRWDLTEQPKEPTKQSKAPETRATPVDNSDSEWMETPNSVWPQGRLWTWRSRRADGLGFPQQEVGHRGPPCSIDLDACVVYVAECKCILGRSVTSLSILGCSVTSLTVGYVMCLRTFRDISPNGAKRCVLERSATSLSQRCAVTSPSVLVWLRLFQKSQFH